MPNKINDFLWEIGAHEQQGMNVPIHIYANELIEGAILKDRTMKQAMNSASLPSIVKHMLLMPDAHEGYGFPVGGVAAFDAESGIIAPSVVGYDINCGVRLIRTNMKAEDVKPKLSVLMDSLFKNIPSGVGSRINLGFTRSDMEKVSSEGVKYIIEKGFGFKDDLNRIEENGCMEGADIEKVSQFAVMIGALPTYQPPPKL